MMYSQLYQYLLQHKELPLPGIGTFLVQRTPAVVDFPNRMINPPSYAIALQPGGQLPGKNFFSWLARALGISDRDAIFRFNDFAFELKKQISGGAVINWDGIGTLNKGLAGDVKFTPAADTRVIERPVSAGKVIRSVSEHMVRVGEDQKTAVQMTELLGQHEAKRSYWWAYALGVGLLSIAFISWHLAKQGADISATTNTEKLVPLETGATYRSLP